MDYRPQTGEALSAFAEALLRGPSPLSRGERELIGARVSQLNGCDFCVNSHSAIAAVQLPGGEDLVDRVRHGAELAPVSARLSVLLAIA
ncbi:MAG: carboxymuconolactone decarboxylase family protein [Candidatus Dormibacteria bacterium]